MSDGNQRVAEVSGRAVHEGFHASAATARARGAAALSSTTLDRWALARIQRTVGSAPIRFLLWDGFELPPSAIVEANGRYSRDRLEPYARQLQRRFGDGPLAALLSRIVPRGIPIALALRLLDKSWFVRHVVLDRWFLHARDEALAPA